MRAARSFAHLARRVACRQSSRARATQIADHQAAWSPSPCCEVRGPSQWPRRCRGQSAQTPRPLPPQSPSSRRLTAAVPPQSHCRVRSSTTDTSRDLAVRLPARRLSRSNHHDAVQTALAHRATAQQAQATTTPASTDRRMR